MACVEITDAEIRALVLVELGADIGCASPDAETLRRLAEKAPGFLYFAPAPDRDVLAVSLTVEGSAYLADCYDAGIIPEGS